MRKKAKIFSPDEIRTQISQAVERDMKSSSLAYARFHCPSAMLRYRLGTEIDKKYTSISGKDADSRRTLAFIKFLNVNMHMANFGKEDLDLPPIGYVQPQSRYDYRSNVLLRARAILHWVLSPFSEDEWFHATKHGPGTSIGVPYMDTSIEAKSKLPITVTRRAASLLKRYLDFDFQLKSAVVQYNSDTPIGDWFEIVEGSRATTVPKNGLIDRMIAVEPTGNMFLQQGLMTLMYRRMKAIGLDLETLPIQHNDRARIASITSNEATIDWSSASDCVSIELLRWLIPPQWFECCDMVRSPSISIDGHRVILNMFSTMGNAVTFPLETLIFWSLAQGVRLENTGSLTMFPEWKHLLVCSAFGDDCIVPSDIAEDFIWMMESVGFIPNEKKTFIGSEFKFRESCGGDYFRGYDVRPFYLKAPTSKRLSALEPWLYIIGNRLIAKYITCFGTRNYIYEREFLAVLVSMFTKYNLKLKVVPDDFPDDAGLKISQDLERFHACYPSTLSRITCDRFGMLRFNFCKFEYFQTGNRFADIRYADWLKNPVCTRSRGVLAQLLVELRLKHHGIHLPKSKVRELALQVGRLEDELTPPWYDVKRKGSYVVAKAETVHWTVPNLNRG